MYRFPIIALLLTLSYAKRIDPFAATGLVSSNPLGSSGKNITAPAPQGPGFSIHGSSVKAKHDLNFESMNLFWNTKFWFSTQNKYGRLICILEGPVSVTLRVLLTKLSNCIETVNFYV